MRFDLFILYFFVFVYVGGTLAGCGEADNGTAGPDRDSDSETAGDSDSQDIAYYQMISSFDTPEWSAGTVDEALKVEGTGSLRWEHANDADGCFEHNGQPFCYIHLYPETPLNLSRGDFVSFWIHNDVPSPYNDRPHATFEEVVDQRIYVNLLFDGGYYDTHVRLDFVGWKQYAIDKHAFLGTDSESGWERITDIAMFVTNTEGGAIPERTVHLDNLTLSGVSPGGIPARFMATFESGSFDPDIGKAIVLGQHVVDKENDISEYRLSYATIVDNPVPSALNPSQKVFQSHISEAGYARAEYEGRSLETEEKTYIYAWKEYFPGDSFNAARSDWLWAAFGQWKTYPCEEYSPPYGDLICGGGGIFNDRRGFTDGTFTLPFRAEPDCYEYTGGTYEKDVWTSYALEVYWTNSQNGYYRLYKNGAFVDERIGFKTLFDEFQPGSCDMKWAMGVYIDWSDLGAGAIKYYLDDMAIFDLDDPVTMADVLAWQQK